MKNQRLSQQNQEQISLTLAISTQWHTFPERFTWCSAHALGMAYTPNGSDLSLTRDHLIPYLEKNIPVRHHGYFPGFELGDVSIEKAQQALDLHKRAVDSIVGLGEQVMTIHLGLIPTIELNPSRTEKNFCTLVEYAAARGITIALENLRRGPTSNPEYVLDLATKSGSAITLDVGHAVSSDRVLSHELEVPQIIDMFRQKLVEVHFYEYETDTHYAPSDMSILGPIVTALLTTECHWWTLEIIEYDDILRTINLVRQYIEEKNLHISFPRLP